MKKSLIVMLAAVLSAALLAGCSSSGSSLEKLSTAYAAIADNNRKLADADEEIQNAEGKRQLKLMKKMESLTVKVHKSNGRLADKASKIAQRMVDAKVPVAVSPTLDIKVRKGFYKEILTADEMANVVVEIPFEGDWEGEGYILWLDKRGEVLSRSVAHVAYHSFFASLRITGGDDAEFGSGDVSRIAKAMIVSRGEYERGAVAVGGEASAAVEGVVQVKGVKIVGGAPLAKTLEKFSKKELHWGYNEDYGLSVTVGNVWILIDEDDVTPKGLEMLDRYDMEGDLKFSTKYIKPSARIATFEVQ